MSYFLDDLKKNLRLSKDVKIVFPPPEIKADLAILSFKNDPQKLVLRIAEINLPIIEKAEAVGRYVNLTLNKQQLAALIIKGAARPAGGGKIKNKKIFIEFSSPNIAKPMHVGHLRNTAIGNSLKKIYQALGCQIVSANYLGDWGSQFGQLLLAWQKSRSKKLSVRFLSELYTAIHRQIAENPELADEARALSGKLEEGDRQLLALWRKFREISIKEFRRIYKELGVNFDLWNGESFYRKAAEKIIQTALREKVAKKSEGAIVVDLEKYSLRSYLLQKSDGVPLYSARDLAAAVWRLKKYRSSKIIYVVGREQELYFQQIFKTLALLGYPAERLAYVGYNTVTISGKKAATRAGRVVLVEDIISEAVKRAKKINPRLSISDIKKIGFGAVIYNILSQRRDKPVEFSWNRAVNLKGGSAPYVQYSYVRAKSILKNAKLSPKVEIGKLSDREGKLIMFLMRYPEVVKEAGRLNEPHLIAHYLNELAQEFNRFYNEIPVLKADAGVKQFRLALVKETASVIKNGLELLGIEIPKKM